MSPTHKVAKFFTITIIIIIIITFVMIILITQIMKAAIATGCRNE